MNEFIQRVKNFGIGRIIKSYDFIISLVISLVGIFTFFEQLLPMEIRTNFLSDIIGASITVTTLVLAGFAIVISLMEKELVHYLKKYNIYDNIIFTFEYTAIISLLTFFVSLISKYLYFNKYLFYFNLFLTIYLIATLVQLIFFITAFGIKKGELYK
ncbi:MAG: hypothetical protein COV33_00975 [Candidatus Zambryskibacteria bacterium CG10_big_fil_rev_8_21_14_0_10_34_34]|uniref:Uncharacterized protein n=1 Tax=Candidatus Zambryskibacteria bacterium CG10_big_fil_rev_8_21_14_0_10_34_34 TaxID=1975114 RepID=A0A2H0R122_9BACT|nr:MAG: hypothetical protein COV33_00975 [Candidatus Zambryskibacteria bacterium CG10_big_fil_rev_8_21_14_0_10_34_34]